jgi:hypothetical protein
MDKVLSFIGDADHLAFYFGIALALIGALTPKKFVGFEIDWSSARSGFAVSIGIAFIAFSFRQLRFWKSQTINVELSALEEITAEAKEAQDLAKSAASNTSDNATCVTRANQSVNASKMLFEFLDGVRNPPKT